MPLGSKQNNSFLHATLDVWQDKVFYNEQEFPAGHFAASILNVSSEEFAELAESGGRFGAAFPVLIRADEQTARNALPELREQMLSLAELLWRLPPFSLNDQDGERAMINMMLDEKTLRDIRASGSEAQSFYLRYCAAMAHIPLAVFHFSAAVWFFEQNYLRRLKKRNEAHFAIAAHDCFNSRAFWENMDALKTTDLEPFTLNPQLRSTYGFARSPKNEKEMVFVNRVFFDGYMDFLTYDLFNGLHHGHAPSRCIGCGTYFLTTNGHIPKYCDGVAPQDSRMTCRQYGVMMRQKEQNKQHPVYRVFNTRTNTIRKHHQRGNISKDLREAALRLAEDYRDRALMDKTYADDGYERDMEQERLYAEAGKHLK